MATFSPGTVVKVPFPYTDRPTRQSRPALVIVDLSDHGLLWVAMITSAENRPWPRDVVIPDHLASGLPAPSIIRTAKIATLERSDATPLGSVSAEVFSDVQARIAQLLNLVPE